MLDGNLEPSEYKLVRSKLTPEKERLEAKINALGTKKDNDAEAIDFGFYFLTNLHKLFTSADLSLKRRIIGSTFPAKMIFENGRVRTTQGDDVVTLITAVGAGLKQNRKGNQKNFDDPSCRVGTAGFEPATSAMSRQHSNQLS